MRSLIHLQGLSLAIGLAIEAVILTPSSGLQAASPRPAATPVNKLHVLPGFRVELLYSVPGAQEGSWVSMTPDPKGRLIVCDQYGGLFRVTVPAIGGSPSEVKVEPIEVNLGQAQGLLYAFDSLYVMVNGRQKGLYRVTDTDGDDQFDKVTLLRRLEQGGEHGPHAIVLAPDGKSLYTVIGDQTRLTKFTQSRVPMVWDEDLLLPRVYGRGFMKGVPAPGGYISQVSPDGKDWTLHAVGFRNEYDAAFNHEGELFTYDADMEWDINTPWYRPTRVCHVVSGAEFGWRNGSGKWPPRYPDSVPPVVNIGPGSPTGVTFGYGAKFPAKYQEAFYISDWSYGKLYAVHLKPKGASYTAKFELFISGQPLPLTDIVIHPKDGAMYFTVGGRRTQSGLYRVTYTGSESTAPARRNPAGAAARALRHQLERFHGRQDPAAVNTLWPYLGHPDRFIRYAARVALEFQDPATWRERALKERNYRASINAMIALARVGEDAWQPRLLESLDRLVWGRLTDPQRVDLIRAYGLAFMRMGAPNDSTRKRMIERFDPHYPAEDRALNAELCQMLVYLQAPSAARKSLALLSRAASQDEELDYVKSLRHLTTGWNRALRRRYFGWFVKAATYRGGASFGKFVEHIKADAVAHLSASEKADLKGILEAKPTIRSPLEVLSTRTFVKEWNLDELVGLVNQGLHNRNFDRGRRLFGEVACFSCHRFQNEGGAMGPDLTGVAGRFSPHDLLESIVDPNKAVSDQYAPVVITKRDGENVTGRIINLAGDTLMVNPNMFDPNEIVGVRRSDVVSIEPSKVSMMPEGLLNSLRKDEILDLTAYLLSQGNPNGPMFRKNKAAR